jgi:uncharacterized protein (TIGR02145 family)
MTGLLALALAALSCGESLVDARDGQRYPTLRVGDQCWTGRNAASVGRTCYGNDPEGCRTYGGLYTWDQARQACPAGWHLPSREEWETLAGRLGTATAAEKLKARKDHVPAFDGTDEVGFTALPAGAAFRGAFGRQGTWRSSGHRRRTGGSARCRPPSTGCGTRRRRGTGAWSSTSST